MPIGITLDTGALIAPSKNRQAMKVVIAVARKQEAAVIIPANAIAESWRERTDVWEHVLSLGVVQPVTKDIAKAAGEALAQLFPKHRKSAPRITDAITIDATIIATAAVYGQRLYTGDVGDMARFALVFPNVQILKA